MEIDLSQFHQVFFEESFEGLDTMEQELLHLEAGSDLENINTIFRAAHSIKGGSATFSFKEIADFTHVLETLLDEMREGSRPVTREVVDLLLKSVDCLRGMLTRTQKEEDMGDSHIELINYFNELLSGEAPQEKDDAVEQEVNLSLSEPQDQSPWTIKFVPESYILETGNEPLRMFRELKAFGALDVKANLEKVPDFDELKAEECYMSWDLSLDSEIEIEAIKEVFEWVEDDCVLEIARQEKTETQAEQNTQEELTAEAFDTDSEAVVEKTKKADKPVKSQPAEQDKPASSQPQQKLVSVKKDVPPKTEKKTAASASIRVGIDKVDTLIDLVGELVITQSMLGELGENFDMSKLNQLISGLSELEQNTRELQESVMRIRMLPIGFVFNRLPRMVRDLSSQLGKKVNLEIKGESTELDKTVMEQIGDPLTHLVRNALDHGIESVEKRVEQGKDEEGTLILNAFHQGGNIVIEVVDDGGGIDPDIIYEKAVDKGLIQPGTDIPRDHILSLIMEPGFSTAEIVSDVSGRGVGMDVVKRNINNLGGSVEIHSELGQGTTFTIRLPLTLAILDGQLIKVANEVFVLPLVSIIESVPLTMAEISTIAGDMKVYKLHDEYVPIIDLKDEFEIKHELTNVSDGLLAIVEGENRRIALRIDELLGQQQVVIKSLESHYKSIQGVSGATILGDGRVSLILDIVGLAKRASERASRKRERVA
ncbi:chemotaxis protein CheA [Aliikangiella coralliicola]|uniref:Chemotaxis protein CheA n=1 Tax=Aliikangiella coralliicola TaxID=2592383 RepID=A0A545UB85_9GAMM|nr:chemotaxis protein CheA [Aliikangiella coralliicola]TQV86717.1 chemotaxis protein CheA [Aliikangiella coralliicola]